MRIARTWAYGPTLPALRVSRVGGLRGDAAIRGPACSVGQVAEADGPHAENFSLFERKASQGLDLRIISGGRSIRCGRGLFFARVCSVCRELVGWRVAADGARGGGALRRLHRSSCIRGSCHGYSTAELTLELIAQGPGIPNSRGAYRVTPWQPKHSTSPQTDPSTSRTPHSTPKLPAARRPWHPSPECPSSPATPQASAR